MWRSPVTRNSPGKLRVLALAAEAFGGRGGIAQSTRDLMLALSSLPEVAKIDILPRLQLEQDVCLPIGIQQFAAKSSRLTYALRALWLGMKLRPHVVYCGHAFMAPLASIVARMAGARLICHVHGLEVWQPLSTSKKQAIAASDVIFCVSQYTADKVVEMTGADPNCCKVIYNTFDEQFMLGDRVAARKKFNVPEDALVISTVSRLDPRQRHKGHERVIPLLTGIAEDYPNFIYLIVGTGGDRARLEALVRENGAVDIVRFLGFVADKDLPDLYRASDLYVMPSHGEGFGIAFVEAMACGTPALGLDVGGAGEALRNGELGRSVSEADFPAALRDNVLAPPLDHTDLAVRTSATFARTRFVTRVAEAIAPLMADPPVSREAPPR
jgi:phosphatidylinositol alpha-1,6-mannosyltransferase